MSDSDDVHVLRRELRGLFERIQTIRREIASIRKPGEDNDRFATMSDELDAIVEATETATDTIMENAESIDEIIRNAQASIADQEAARALDAVPDRIGAIFEACSFQDITGQRITKVVKTLQYIEQRVNGLIHVWGESGLSDVETRDEHPDLSADDDRRLLNGPQLQGKGVSQSDIDAIMGGKEPPPREPQAAKDRPESRRKPAPPSQPERKDEGSPPAMDQNDIDSLFD
jgi:chemotaxis protein CheZ